MFAFGPYRLCPARRLLLKSESPVPIGSRALEILIALVQRQGQLVTRDELFACAWPHTIVEESSLRAQVAALRKVLQEPSSEAAYIVTVPGQGYRFVGTIHRTQPEPAPSPMSPAAGLPVRLAPVIGRTEAMALLETRLQRCRFVTVVGPGGVGKTTVAVATAARTAGSYRDGVCFLDASALGEGSLLPTALGTALGLSLIADDLTGSIAAQLRPKQMLIVLDNCERIAEAAARLAERMLKSAPEVRLLVTGREPLRAEGESVYRLGTLDAPPAAAGMSAIEALRFPAVELLVERAAARVDGFLLADTDAAVAADICRQLDGIPLAIELAAGRVDAYGLRGIAERLDDRFRLLKGGRRTALPRHQTLLATLEWSYDVLPEGDRRVLRALAIFAGCFTFDAAEAVTVGAHGEPADIVDIMASLVSRSLVSAEIDHGAARYRLLESTRAYARSRLEDCGERERVAQAHATYFRQLFQQALRDWESRDVPGWLADYARESDNLRAALDWAFSASGDPELGIDLTIAAIPLWFRLSATDECRMCVQRALARAGSPETHERRTQQVMQLYAALGLSRTFTLGLAPEASAAWHKSLELAQGLGDREHQREALWGLWLCQIGDGDYRDALSTAESFSELAESVPDQRMAHRLVGVPRHCLGDHTGAREHIEAVLKGSSPVTPAGIRFRFGQPMAARVILAQMLWLQGFPDRAMDAARRSVEESAASGHAISHSDALAQAMCPIALRVGDFDTAESSIRLLQALTERYALGPWALLGKCWQGTLSIARGERDAGIRLLEDNLEGLRDARFSFYRTQFMGTLAVAMTERGEVERGQRLIEAALTRCRSKEELWCLPEMLRLNGTILSPAMPDAGSLAEDLFEESLECARTQQALSWELRAAMSLAEHQRRAGLTQVARTTVDAVYGRFTEGFETADLKAARQLLAAVASGAD